MRFIYAFLFSDTLMQPANKKLWITKLATKCPQGKSQKIKSIFFFALKFKELGWTFSSFPKCSNPFVQ